MWKLKYEKLKNTYFLKKKEQKIPSYKWILKWNKCFVGNG